MIKLLDVENKNFIEKDLKALEGYVVSYSTWRSCVAIISEKGFTVMTPSGYEQQRPEVSIGNKAQIEMRNWMRELGLTEKSRSSMNKNNNTPSSNKENYPKDAKEMDDVIDDD